jgi:hypothetical protein
MSAYVEVVFDNSDGRFPVRGVAQHSFHVMHTLWDGSLT